MGESPFSERPFFYPPVHSQGFQATWTLILSTVVAFSQGDFATAGDSPGPPLPSLESQLFDRSQVPDFSEKNPSIWMAMAISYNWLVQWDEIHSINGVFLVLLTDKWP